MYQEKTSETTIYCLCLLYIVANLSMFWQHIFSYKKKKMKSVNDLIKKTLLCPWWALSWSRSPESKAKCVILVLRNIIICVYLSKIGAVIVVALILLIKYFLWQFSFLFFFFIIVGNTETSEKVWNLALGSGQTRPPTSSKFVLDLSRPWLKI